MRDILNQITSRGAKGLILIVEGDLRTAANGVNLGLEEEVMIFVKTPEELPESANRILIAADGERISADTVDFRDLINQGTLNESCRQFVESASAGWTPRDIRECHACGLMHMPPELDGLDI